MGDKSLSLKRTSSYRWLSQWRHRIYEPINIAFNKNANTETDKRLMKYKSITKEKRKSITKCGFIFKNWGLLIQMENKTPKVHFNFLKKVQLVGLFKTSWNKINSFQSKSNNHENVLFEWFYISPFCKLFFDNVPEEYCWIQNHRYQ